MAKHKRKHHKHVGKRTQKRSRSRVGAISKSGIMDVAVIGATALATRQMLTYVEPMLPATITPTYKAYGKLAIGIALGSMAEGKAKPYVEGAALAMIIDGGGKVLDSLIKSTPIAGTVNNAVRYHGNTVAGRRHISGMVNQGVNYGGNTVAGARQVTTGM